MELSVSTSKLIIVILLFVSSLKSQRKGKESALSTPRSHLPPEDSIPAHYYFPGTSTAK
jgi:hypothetical protein